MNLAITTTIIATLACLAWFISRRRHRRVWLPITIIFTASRRTFPRLQFSRPPWIACLCFLVVASALAIFSYRPQLIYEISRSSSNVFLLIDFSPSVAAQLTIEQYRTFLEEQYSRLNVAGVGTTHNLSIKRFVTSDDFRNYLQKLEFHRSGAILSKILQQQTAELKEFDHIVVVADRDNYSWQGFLGDQSRVSVLDVPSSQQEGVNLYVHQLRNNMPHHPTLHYLDIEIARNNNRQDSKFALEITDRNNQPLREVSQHQMTDNRLLSSVSVTLSRNEHLEEIVIRIIADDALSIDNIFFYALPTKGSEVIVSGDLASESLIDDPLYRLQTALEVLGLRIDRQITVPSNQQSTLWIVAFGKNFASHQHCPDRQQARQFWLMPQYQDYHQSEACRCYLKLMNRKATCNNLVEALPNQGENRLIWQHDNITVLTVSPRRLGYAQLPVLIEQLLDQQQIDIAKLKGNWPRHDTLAEHDPLRPSNVPRGESLLVETDNRPPALTPTGEQIVSEKHGRVWITILLIAVAIVCLVEAANELIFQRQPRQTTDS